MKKTLESISKLGSDINYLKEEYEKVKMWGSCPDGDLEFETLATWLSNDDNLYTMELLINLVKSVKSINKS